MEGLEYLNKIAVAKTGAFPRMEHGKGEVIAYCGAPMVCIRREDGSAFWWRVDLCEFEQRPTMPAPDAVDSAVISIIPHADSVSYLEGES